MSEFDESNFDETDTFDEGEGITPEDIFQIVMINKARGTSLYVELFDEDGNEVELSEIIEQLLTYIEDKVSSDEPTQFVDQIMPLMAQSVISGLARMLGLDYTAFYLTNETSRIALINMMAIAFLLLKYLQKNKITIRTVEKEISEEEIEEIQRKANAGSAATMGAFLGLDPREILENLVEKGDITQEDLDAILNKDEED